MSGAAKTLRASVTPSIEPLAPPPPPPPPVPKPIFLKPHEKHTVHWFRKGLRLHDNPALREGLRNAATFRCVFIIDPWFASSSNVGINKWRFLLQCLEDLDNSLKKLNSRLFVVRGQPADALPKLFREWGTTFLTFEEDPEPYGRVRDQNITTKCQEVGISVVSRVSHTLYKLDSIIERNGGKAPLTYHQFQALIASMPPPPRAESTITKQMLNGAMTPILQDHNDRFGVPSLEELEFVEISTISVHTTVFITFGTSPKTFRYSDITELTLKLAGTDFKVMKTVVCTEIVEISTNSEKGTIKEITEHQSKPAPGRAILLLISRLGNTWVYSMTGFDTENLKPPVWLGGENEALARLERHLERKAWVATFGRPKMTPQSLLASSTGLSPYLRFGCLSTRLFYFQLTELYKRVKRVRPPLSLHGQILWREFFYCAATRNPNFDRMEGNPICVQIPWEKNQEALAKWANGQTGFPWIDAIMVQLREEGWIHHLARHAVACFLTRGDLWISWEEGMKVFDELLLDADWSVNAGMWMWLSCSSFFQQFFHCYCPVRFGRKTDPNGDYIRKYVPALKNMPAKYIHEPWVAPLPVQESAQCIIGRDYPLPMVDHSKASAINIERIKQVYTQLAKYKPQSALNPQVIQRPNVMQSSPSPNSIIRSINQSNYLCSQAPESQPPSSNTPDIYKQEVDFVCPNKNQIRSNKDSKRPQFKQVVIVQEDLKRHQRNTSITENNYIVNTFKMKKNVEFPHPGKPNNYDLENFVINDHLQNYANDLQIKNRDKKKNETFMNSSKVDEYIIMKPKFYYTENEIISNKNENPNFTPHPLTGKFIPKDETVTSETESGSHNHTIASNNETQYAKTNKDHTSEKFN